MEQVLNVFSFDQLQDAVRLVLREKELDNFLAKPQINRTELLKYYGAERSRKWLKANLLKPISQNGKGSKVYYDHKKVIELSKSSFHHLNKPL